MYDATNQLSLMTYPNGVTHSYSYDTRDRVLTLNGYTQAFSPSERKQSVSETTGRASNYSYDNIYRLLSETVSGDPTSANNGALAYALDPVGNRQSMTSTLAALQAQNFTYDADDRISGDTFDANGNTLTSGGVTYTYDFEDRLLTTSSGVTIVYDGGGKRVSETAAGTATQYLFDDLTPTGYAQVAEELVSGAVTAQFTHGPMRIGQRRTATSFYGYDAGGSVRQLIDNTGTVTDTYAGDSRRDCSSANTSATVRWSPPGQRR
jgi:YD repeat-containing protein